MLLEHLLGVLQPKLPQLDIRNDDESMRFLREEARAAIYMNRPYLVRRREPLREAAVASVVTRAATL